MQTEESLRGHNTLALEASAQALATVADDAELLQALEWAQQQSLPVTPLGEGSNIVLAGDLQALVLCQGSRGVAVLDESDGEVLLRASAGQNWHALVQWCLAEGLHGLENLALIPGTAGAAPIQNIGAYGVELSSVLHAVRGYHIAGGVAFALDRAGCELGYRDSVFKGRLRDTVIITEIELVLSRHWQPQLNYAALAGQLEKNASPTAREVFEAVVAIRRSKLPDPANEPNVGSFFKNPVIPAPEAEALLQRFPELPSYPQADAAIKVPAAWLIDACGWKGRRRDGVGVHPEHALVLVNYTAIHGSKLLQFADDIAHSVKDRFGIALEIEPRIYGVPR